MDTKKLLRIARGEEKADLVFKQGKVIDVFNEELFEADLAVADGIIVGTGNYQGEREIDLKGKIISPGFIDGHLHLESAMVTVEEFASRIIPAGTLTIVADPHEIANIAGVTGIKYLLERGRALPWNFNLMLPSCVPATPYETSGANLKAGDLEPLLKEEGIFGLGEVMDYPGVIEGKEYIWDKINLVGDRFKDGHGPGLTGKELNAYLMAGIKADHEATTAREALEKVRKGMYVMIREGSVTRDLKSLIPAVKDNNNGFFLFATDDRHPGDLVQEGHINFLIKKAVKCGVSPLRAIRLASLNAARALGLANLGALAPGYKADLVILEDLKKIKISQVYKDGQLVAEDGKPLFEVKKDTGERPASIFSSVKVKDVEVEDFKLPAGKKFRVMELIKDQVITKKREVILPENPTSEALVKNDLAKIAVVERHHGSGNIGLGLIKGSGLKAGAIATSIAHDSHNIIVTGISATDMKLAVEKIVELKGGIVIVKDGVIRDYLALPIAGLMSERPLIKVAKKLCRLRKVAVSQGVKIDSPFMTLSFMALPVIPELKITDRGLFDVENYSFVSLVKE